MTLTIADQIDPIKLRPGVRHGPNTDRQSILPSIIDHPRRNWESSLRSDVRYELSILISIDPKHRSRYSSGRSAELKAEWDVKIRIDVEMEGGSVHANARGVESDERRGAVENGRRGREAWQWPPKTLAEESAFIHGSADSIDVGGSTCVTLNLPGFKSSALRCG